MDCRKFRFVRLVVAELKFYVWYRVASWQFISPLTVTFLILDKKRLTANVCNCTRSGVSVEPPGWDAAKTLIALCKVSNALVNARKFICV